MLWISLPVLAVKRWSWLLCSRHLSDLSLKIMPRHGDHSILDLSFFPDETHQFYSRKLIRMRICPAAYYDDYITRLLRTPMKGPLLIVIARWWFTAALKLYLIVLAKTGCYIENWLVTTIILMITVVIKKILMHYSMCVVSEWRVNWRTVHLKVAKTNIKCMVFLYHRGVYTT